MKVFVSASNVPIGYSVPGFPSLFWPLGPTAASYQLLFLYYSIDIWCFTVYWSLFFFTVSYTLVGVTACANMNFKCYRELKMIPQMQNRSVFGRLIMVAVMYVLMGASQGFFSGALVGLMLLAIYRAGSLAMSTWIPFCWGFAMIFYHICLSYSTSLLLIWAQNYWRFGTQGIKECLIFWVGGLCGLYWEVLMASFGESCEYTELELGHPSSVYFEETLGSLGQLLLDRTCWKRGLLHFPCDFEC